jgi:hypothetical protein
MKKIYKKYAKDILKSLIEEYSRKSFNELTDLEYPVIKTYTKNNKTYQAELIKLEATDDYIHISVGVSAGGISDYLPFSDNILVYKDKAVNS